VIFGMPWWVFMMIVFIFFSGYMSFRAMRAEKELEKHYIERDGQVFLERIEDERERRRLKQSEEIH
jgi:Sporulation protein YhaL